MARVGWLHLTDLHHGTKAQDTLWQNIEQKFYEDLKALYPSCGPWDFIIFTGDLVQAGSAKQYQKLEDVLERLYKRLGALGSNPVLLAIPGNHDVMRPDSGNDDLKRLLSWHADATVPQEFWRDRSSKLKRLVKKSFQNFMKWRSNSAFTKGVQMRDGILPGDFSATLEKGGLRIGIVGLNTAFLQLAAGDFEGRLAVDVEQLSAACGEHFTDWFERHSFCLFLTHHPPQWLHVSARSILTSEIAIPGRFLAHFCGHLHDSRAEDLSVAGSPRARVFQGASLFGLAEYGTRRERIHGYLAAEVRVASSQTELRVWPRRADRHQLGYWHFVPDSSFILETSGNVAPERIEIRTFLPTSHTQGPFRVLLISTEPDLLETRKQVADHLRRSLGVTVVEASDVLPTSVYDVAVLIQAWWWDRGSTAALWDRTAPPKRVSFVADPQADWPPRKFVEIGADAEVRKFREGLTNAIKFGHPVSLPELVGAKITELIQEQQGGEELGLKPWERNYLTFRLPA